jgi:Na+/H+ antiporter NhaD/arsenite permease-like protein
MMETAMEWVPQVVFGWDAMWTSALVLAATYVVIMSDKLNIAVVALAGAAVTIFLGILNQAAAVRGIDFNTLALLIGMMIIVALTARSGVFQYLAIAAAKFAKGSPAGILVMMQIVTAVVSAFLDNVTTVLLVAPVTLLICETLRVKPFPFLVAEILASNIGGTATLIGDPPNILIGSSAGLSFNDFVVHVAPGILFVQAVTILCFHLLYGRNMRASPEALKRIMSFDQKGAITDPRLLKQSAIVLALVLIGFWSARFVGLEVGTIGMAGATLLMILHVAGKPSSEQSTEVADIFNSVDWTTILFFAGLFVVVYGVDVSGLLRLAAEELMAATGGDAFALLMAILWGSALISSIVNNIPYVAAMIPLIKAIGDTPGSPFAGGPEALMPLWWALSFGACLGGNGTLIGASANLTVAGLAERAGNPIRFIPYTKVAFPFMIVSTVVGMIYLILRYL